MKTAVVIISRITKELTGEYLRDLSALFESSQISIDSLEIINPSDDIGFLRKLERSIDYNDNLLLFSSDAEFSVNQIICDKLDTVLLENDNAKGFLDAIKKADGKDYSDEYALLPIDATVIPNLKGAMQGYILDNDSFTLCYLPSDLYQALPMCSSYVLPYLEKKSGKISQKLTLKYFGDVNLLYNTLDKAKEFNSEEWSFDIKEKFSDVTVNLAFSELVSDLERGQIVRFIVSSLKENIYAEMDVSLSERLFDLLKLRKIKLSIAESFTSGRIVADVIKNSGASSYVDEGVVTYSNQSKISRLGVKEADLTRVGAVSSVVAYQMASGLLKGGRCDMAISTTGIAGPKSDDSLKPVGLCYIGIGTKNGVHTYKYNLTGSREEITEKAKNTALFLAIKALKNI